MVFSGSEWGNGLRTDRTAIETAAKETIASSLAVNVSRVQLLSVVAGSLIVDFQLLNAATDSVVYTTSQVTSLVQSANAAPLQQVYASTTGDTTVISVTSTGSRSSVVYDGGDCGPGCLGVILAVVIVSIAVVLAILALLYANIIRRRNGEGATRRKSSLDSAERGRPPTELRQSYEPSTPHRTYA